ncbi:hypothetical protein PBI_INGRID_72 [Arthrobacter phage Ingrid]|nr:hypothetical protein PBI_INGRID_72 [Arthrobacter phage Ingrid]QFG11051.1 hypothetical protein PBI_LORETTA_69 [Arthrobacter phage Loretta]
MPTFRKVEIVDAREFKGGSTNANSLVLWVNSNEGKAEHHTGGNFIDYIRVYESYASRIFEMAFPGDWIERRQNGTFQVTRKQVIATYEEV